MFRRILVPLDGTKAAASALSAAVAIARRSDGEIRLLTVDRGEGPIVNDCGWVWDVDERSQSRPMQYLERASRQLESLGPHVTTAVRMGSPSEEIIREAERYDAELVVMAPHRPGIRSEAGAYGVADACVRRLHRPVLLARPRPVDEPISGSFSFGRIVVPLDGSALAECALGPATALSRLFAVPVLLLRIVHDDGVIGGRFPLAIRESVTEETRAAAAAYLEERARPIRASGGNAEVRVTFGDDVPRAVLDEAAGDLIVMSTHARGPLGRALLGSVTEAVLSRGSGPVLVIPPEGGRPAHPAGSDAGRVMARTRV